jgi:acyl-CoA dehydrogenase
VDGLIGDENTGWTVAKFLLQHERGGAWAPLLRARWRRLLRALEAAFAPHASDHPERRALRLKLADAACRIDAVQALEMSALRAQARGEAPGVRPSMGKVLGSETRQHLTELGVEIAAHYAHARLPLAEAASGELPLPEESVFSMSAYLNDRAASIYGGSNEVQRNLIAARLIA